MWCFATVACWCSLPAATPVSYTHLDVYKRQEYARRFADQVRELNIPYLLNTMVLDLSPDRVLKDDGVLVAPTFTPVSYTHLILNALVIGLGRSDQEKTMRCLEEKKALLQDQHVHLM